MSDIEFAKEVAEKVWGWTLSSDGNLLEPGSEPHLYNMAYSGDHIMCEVNSWAGFGRTVEAMFKMGWGIEALPDEYYVGFCNAKGKCFAFLETPENDSARWIKATHQAALDAVKEKE